jgi:hypothetical protein
MVMQPQPSNQVESTSSSEGLEDSSQVRPAVQAAGDSDTVDDWEILHLVDGLSHYHPIIYNVS